MPGHGSIINGSTGQDDTSVYVDDTGESHKYSTGIQNAINYTGGSVNQGDVVNLEWDEDNNQLRINSIGNRATGNVDQDGSSITITDSGNTALSGTISISNRYGENDGWAGADGISLANVNGEGSYLGV